MTYEALVVALLSCSRNMGLADKRFEGGGALSLSLQPATVFAGHAAYAAEVAAVGHYGGRLLRGIAYRPTASGFARLDDGGVIGDGHMGRMVRLANERLPQLSNKDIAADAVRRGLLLAVTSCPNGGGLKARPWPMDYRRPLLSLSGARIGLELM